MPAITSTDTLIIFTTSTTGLGHIRVMDALMDGLLPGSQFTRIGIKNIRANKIHALGSRIPFLAKITEFYQTNPLAEFVVAGLLTASLKRQTREVIARLKEIKEKYPDKKRWIIVSTHFALAYPIVQVKKDLEKRLEVQITNAVVVTDDSPQRVWAVDGSDVIFTPSEETTAALRKFLKKDSLTKIETISFPISPRLTKALDKEGFERLKGQVDHRQNQPLHILVPISGAAVQLDFLGQLIKTLSLGSFKFTVVGQETSYTKLFFQNIKKIARAQVSIGKDARQTVNLYESSFYQGLRPAVEITKPSEQTFKAILKPREIGGVLLLLTSPIGRQEKDNLNFLVRHFLLPNPQEQQQLERHLLQEGKLPQDSKAKWHYQASHWRAINLPHDPKVAAVFIKKLKESGIFFSMLSYVAAVEKDLTSNGVHQIWQGISKVMEKQAK